MTSEQIVSCEQKKKIEILSGEYLIVFFFLLSGFGYVVKRIDFPG